MQKIYINPGETMEVVRSFSLAIFNDQKKYSDRMDVYERPNGSFVYANGRPVDNIAHLESLPPHHKERALKWFRKREAEMDEASKMQQQHLDEEKEDPEISAKGDEALKKIVGHEEEEEVPIGDKKIGKRKV